MALFGSYPDAYTAPNRMEEYPYSAGNPKQVDVEEINKITLSDYGWDANAIKAYMFGIEVTNPDTGQPMGDDFYQHVLEIAIDKAEKALDIVILPSIKHEMRDYYEQDFNSYMFVHAFNKPIIQVESLRMQFNGQPLYDYPANWWKVSHLAGHVQVFPTTFMQTGQQMNVGMMNHVPLIAGSRPPGRVTFAPQMIELKYVSGLLPRQYAGRTQAWELPPSLEQLVLKYALKEIYQVWGNLIIGAGIANRTLDVDGITETIGTTQSAMYGGASAQIMQIDSDIKELLDGLRAYFGYNMVSL